MPNNLVKRCTYCGKEYPAEAQICHLDGHALADVPQPCKAPPLPAYSDRAKLILGFSASVIGFIFFLCVHLKSDRVRPKMFLLMGLLVAGGVMCLAKLLEPWTDRLMSHSDDPTGSRTSGEMSSVGPLRCTYCGKRFPEGMEVCDIDAQPLRRV